MICVDGHTGYEKSRGICSVHTCGQLFDLPAQLVVLFLGLWLRLSSIGSEVLYSLTALWSTVMLEY